MAKFDIRKTSRKCSVSGRPFEPGEAFFSAVKEDDEGQLIRVDYSNKAWEQAKNDDIEPGSTSSETTGDQSIAATCIGWWKSKMPDNRGGRVYWAPTPVLLAYFDHLLKQPGMEDVAFVMSIVLLRNRTLKLTDTDDQSDPPLMTFYHRATKTSYHVSSVEVSSERIEVIQAELAEQLFTDYRENGSENSENGSENSENGSENSEDRSENSSDAEDAPGD